MKSSVVSICECFPLRCLRGDGVGEGEFGEQGDVECLRLNWGTWRWGEGESDGSFEGILSAMIDFVG